MQIGFISIAIARSNCIWSPIQLEKKYGLRLQLRFLWEHGVMSIYVGTSTDCHFKNPHFYLNFML